MSPIISARARKPPGARLRSWKTWGLSGGLRRVGSKSSTRLDFGSCNADQGVGNREVGRRQLRLNSALACSVRIPAPEILSGVELQRKTDESRFAASSLWIFPE